MQPDIPPEAVVIRLAREATGMTAQSAAEASRKRDGQGVSAAYWRDVERGYGGRRGERVPTRASARALAAMARTTGVQPAQLTSAGREDAARVLEEIMRREGSVPARAGPVREDVDPSGGDREGLHPWRQQVLREVYTAAGVAGRFSGELPDPAEVPGAEAAMAFLPGRLIFDVKWQVTAWDDRRLSLNERLDYIAATRRFIAGLDEDENRRTGLIAATGNYRVSARIPPLFSVGGTAVRASS